MWPLPNSSSYQRLGHPWHISLTEIRALGMYSTYPIAIIRRFAMCYTYSTVPASLVHVLDLSYSPKQNLCHMCHLRYSQKQNLCHMGYLPQSKQKHLACVGCTFEPNIEVLPCVEPSLSPCQRLAIYSRFQARVLCLCVTYHTVETKGLAM